MRHGGNEPGHRDLYRARGNHGLHRQVHFLLLLIINPWVLAQVPVQVQAESVAQAGAAERVAGAGTGAVAASGAP